MLKVIKKELKSNKYQNLQNLMEKKLGIGHFKTSKKTKNSIIMSKTHNKKKSNNNLKKLAYLMLRIVRKQNM